MSSSYEVGVRACVRACGVSNRVWGLGVPDDGIRYPHLAIISLRSLFFTTLL